MKVPLIETRKKRIIIFKEKMNKTLFFFLSTMTKLRFGFFIKFMLWRNYYKKKFNLFFLEIFRL